MSGFKLEALDQARSDVEHAKVHLANREKTLKFAESEYAKSALAARGYLIGDTIEIPEQAVYRGQLACITHVCLNAWNDTLTVKYSRFRKNGDLRSGENLSIGIEGLPEKAARQF